MGLKLRRKNIAYPAYSFPLPLIFKKIDSKFLETLACNLKIPLDQNRKRLESISSSVSIQNIADDHEAESPSCSFGDSWMIEILKNIKNVINKFFYCDVNDTFSKSFGTKCNNLTDLSLTPINLISDKFLVMDINNFVFSDFDLKKLTPSTRHPYLRNIKIDDVRVKNYYLNLLDYHKCYMASTVNLDKSAITAGIGAGSNVVAELNTATQLNNINKLVSLFESSINHEYYTSNLVTIYEKNQNSLDYTVELLYYIVSYIEDYKTRYENLLFMEYHHRARNKYKIFLRNYILFFQDIKRRFNIERYNYITIIVFKVLQYRYCVMDAKRDLYSLVHNEFKPEVLTRLSLSMEYDRPNYHYYLVTGKTSFVSVNIDNIFSNCENNDHYSILINYIHNTFVADCQTSGPILELDEIVNYCKSSENFNYCDLLRYFGDLGVLIINTFGKNTPEHKNFLNMIDVYYLQSSPLHVTSSGTII